MDTDLIKIIHDNFGKISRQEIADICGIPRVRLNRYLAKNKMQSGNIHAYKKSTIDEVLNFYSNHSLDETKKEFPNIKVRSIIDRYKNQYKIHIWNFKDDIEILNMLFELNIREISKKTKKTDKSIIKRLKRIFKIDIRNFGGLPIRLIKPFLIEDFNIKGSKGNMPLFCNWKEIKNNLNTHDDVIISCINSLSKFQEWLELGYKNEE